jgi:hypothetical protein
MLGERPRLPTDKQRALHYQEQAESFRRLAGEEPIERIREQLASLAEQYQQLATRLLEPT